MKLHRMHLPIILQDQGLLVCNLSACNLCEGLSTIVLLSVCQSINQQLIIPLVHLENAIYYTQREMKVKKLVEFSLCCRVMELIQLLVHFITEGYMQF